MRRVAIVGGGMAGLTAAWHLSGPRSGQDLEVTVYQRGWRLGGKGASSRGVNGRIEEHGLHVWLGYYENAFRLMRRVYRQLDRSATDPDCPILGFDHAFAPMRRVGVADPAGEDWSDWFASFSPTMGQPGTGRDTGAATSGVQFVRRAVRLLTDFALSLVPDSPTGAAGPVVLSASPEPPSPPRPGMDARFRLAEIGSLTAALEIFRAIGHQVDGTGSVGRVLLERLDLIRSSIFDHLGRADDSRHARDFADLILTCVRGAIKDQLMSSPAGLTAINHLDLREWLRLHGATEQTCRSAFVTGMYNLAFAYQDGDPDRPRIAAGNCLMYADKMFLSYGGALFWQMQAGMGDVVFAPLYQVLKARGVRFEFFHRLEDVELTPDGTAVAGLTFGRQATVRPGSSEYRPLVRVGGLPCFPAEPIADQLVGDVPADLESHWSDRAREVPRSLRAGTDFDDVILAVSVGMIPHTCRQLLEASPRWRAMVEHVATVPTQALQLWLTPNEESLGWAHAGTAITGFPPPFDTYASMSHLLPRENWPAGREPRSIAHFCSVLRADGTDDPDIARKVVKANATEFLNRRAGHFWPAARYGDGFDWTVLHAVPATDPADESIDAQFWRANVDPSDRYVQTLPGSLVHRLRTDESGWPNLFLAGDWIDNGHNAGCIEAAVLSGMQAANAVRGRDVMTGVRGGYRPGVR